MSETKQTKNLSRSFLENFQMSDDPVTALTDEKNTLTGEILGMSMFKPADNSQLIGEDLQLAYVANKKIKIKEDRIASIEAELMILSKSKKEGLIASMEEELTQYSWYLQWIVRSLYFFLCSLPFTILSKSTRIAAFFTNGVITFFIEKPLLTFINWITGYGLEEQFIKKVKLYLREPENLENLENHQMASLFPPENKISPDVRIEFDELYENANERFRLALAAVFASLTEIPSGGLNKAWFFFSWPFRAALLAVLSLILIAQRVVRELIDSAVLAVLMVTKIIRFTVLVVLNTPLFIYNLPKNLREAWKNRATLAQNFKAMLFENRFALPSNVLLTLSAVGVAAVIFGLNPWILGIIAGVSSVSTLFLSQQALTIGNPKLRLGLSVLFFLTAAALVFFAFGGIWFPSIADFIPHLPHLIIPFSIPVQIGIAAAGTWFMVYLPTLVTAMVNWATKAPTMGPGKEAMADEPSREPDTNNRLSVEDDKSKTNPNNFAQVISQNDKNNEKKPRYTYTEQDAAYAKQTGCFLAIVKPDHSYQPYKEKDISLEPGERIWVNPPFHYAQYWKGKKETLGSDKKEEKGFFPKDHVVPLPPPHWTGEDFQKYGLRSSVGGIFSIKK